MFILDSLLAGGLRFVLDKIARAADAEIQDDSGLREWLAEARMRLERGEISEDEYAAAESDFLAALGRARGAAQPPISMPPGGGADVGSFDSD